jgi:beta-galactosidase
MRPDSRGLGRIWLDADILAINQREPFNTSMLRRNFIQTAGAVLAASALPETALFGTSAPESSSRLILPIHRNWRYHPAPVEGAEAADFDDASFESVVVPHTNIRLPWHSFDNKNYEFISTYRRRFRLPEATRGKRVFVDFEGVMTASTVWINGVRLGEYKGRFHSIFL